MFFILPFQVTRFAGFGPGLVVAILEIVVVFVFEHYKKRFGDDKPIIKV